MADANKKKTPWGALFWGAVGTAAAVRALYRPDRALIKDGFVLRCAATSGCDPAMTIQSFEGTQAVFAPMAGVIVSASGISCQIVPNGEAVLLDFSGSAQFQVTAGDHVGAGQQIGLASAFSFSVYELGRNPDGHAKILGALEPASWLAVHGIRVSSKSHKHTELWCEGGRKIVAPPAVANCLKLPPPSGYALLPISVTTG
jgi:hypothetical protein